MKRNNYNKKSWGLSSQNEPNNDLYLSSNVRLYPDMFYAYKKFSQEFNLPTDTFFLGNGCENTMKNVLLALKPKTMCWAGPTWKMVDVYCEALNIKPIYQQFQYDSSNGEFIQPNIYNIDSDVLYTNCGITTCFQYDFNEHDLYNTKTKYNICDITYQNIEQIRQSIKVLRNNPKNIIVGSFDKLVGCGLRLGFAIYPKELHHQMSLQREQYINSLAFKWLVETDFNISSPKYKNELYLHLSSIDYITDNFITVVGDVNTTLPCYKFEIDNQHFTRFGLPNNDTEYESLHMILDDFIQERMKQNKNIDY